MLTISVLVNIVLPPYKNNVSKNIILLTYIFQEDILHELSDRGIEESVFVKPHKLHMTISVMCLMDNEERLQASKLLTEARDTIIM